MKTEHQIREELERLKIEAKKDKGTFVNLTTFTSVEVLKWVLEEE